LPIAPSWHALAAGEIHPAPMPMANHCRQDELSSSLHMEEEAGKNKDGWVIEMAAIHEIIVN